MLIAPKPSNERERLLAVQSAEILDSAPEPEFDALTEAASDLCSMPIALISLVDADRQWFKSERGLGVTSTDRASSFCAHAILQTEIFEVPDATLDERFADNPLVTGFPHIRYYAGAPIFDRNGLPLGTLCVIDRRPRRLTELRQVRLSYLAASASHLIATRIRPSELAHHARLLRESDDAGMQLRRYARQVAAIAANALVPSRGAV
jgi:GAF domain-containing protein